MAEVKSLKELNRILNNFNLEAEELGLPIPFPEYNEFN